MSKVFGTFYDKLYNCLNTDPNHLFSQDEFNSFFDPLKLPKLTASQITTLNAAITSEELAEVVKELPLHKSLGPDGLPYIYYKAFLPILSLYLIDLFTSLQKGTVPHSQFLHAHSAPETWQTPIVTR